MEYILSLYTSLGSGHLTQIFRLASRYLHSLSHLTGPASDLHQSQSAKLAIPIIYVENICHFLFQLSFGGGYEKQYAEKGAEMKSMIALQRHYGNRKEE